MFTFTAATSVEMTSMLPASKDDEMETAALMTVRESAARRGEALSAARARERRMLPREKK